MWRMWDLKMCLWEPAKTVIAQISQLGINILIVLSILLIGWLAAKMIKFLVTRFLKSVRFVDDLARRVELNDLLSKGGVSYTLSELIGMVFYWVALLVTLVIALNSLGLTIANDILNRLILYIPSIIAGMVIFILGMFAATVLKNIIQTAAANAGLAQAKLLAKFVEVIVVIFAALIAFEQLGLAPKLIELVVSIVLASFGLAFSLAFGFGCQDTAKKCLNDWLEKFKSKK